MNNHDTTDIARAQAHSSAAPFSSGAVLFKRCMNCDNAVFDGADRCSKCSEARGGFHVINPKSMKKRKDHEILDDTLVQAPNPDLFPRYTKQMPFGTTGVE